MLGTFYITKFWFWSETNTESSVLLLLKSNVLLGASCQGNSQQEFIPFCHFAESDIEEGADIAQPALHPHLLHSRFFLNHPLIFLAQAKSGIRVETD